VISSSSARVWRKAAGRDAGEVVDAAAIGVKVVATLAEALATPSDVLVDYTKPDVVGRNVLEAIAAGRHVVVAHRDSGRTNTRRSTKRRARRMSACSPPAISRSPRPC